MHCCSIRECPRPRAVLLTCPNAWTQTCIAPDYVLVHSEIKDRFIETMQSTIKTQLGTDVSKSPLYGRIINEGHWNRVCSYLKDVSDAQVLYGGESDRATRYISPTLVDITSADLDKPIMTDEIFGPLLPIVTVKSMDEAIDFVNSRPKPLAAYIFSSDRHTVESVLSNTTSGTACVNDCVFQFLNAHLPFGTCNSPPSTAAHLKLHSIDSNCGVSWHCVDRWGRAIRLRLIPWPRVVPGVQSCQERAQARYMVGLGASVPFAIPATPRQAMGADNVQLPDGDMICY